jgi:hypothetical protein
MVDTRAGRWLVASVGLIALALVTIRIFAGDEDSRSLHDFLNYALLGVSLLSPVLGILAVTSEWGQRTALTTFALVPRRERVLAAKFFAVLALAVVSVAASLLIGVLGNGVTELLGRGGGWDVGAVDLLYLLLFQALNMVMGYAFGALFLTSGLAIVLYFVIPTAWTVVGQTVSALKDVAGWLDFGTTTQGLFTNDMSGDAWAKLAASVAVWILLPLVAGLIRVIRQEVK